MKRELLNLTCVYWRSSSEEGCWCSGRGNCNKEEDKKVAKKTRSTRRRKMKKVEDEKAAKATRRQEGQR